MIFVLALSRDEVDTWRRRAGLQPKHVHYISSPALGRGRRLTYGDIVKLPGFRYRKDKPEFLMALRPCGVALDRIHEARLEL